MKDSEKNAKTGNGDAQHLERLRHSLAHLMAAAVLELWPGALPTIGPAIDNGFYYDFDFGAVKSSADSIIDSKDSRVAISEKDFPKIEKKMREILKTWKGFASRKVTEKEAKERFAANPYKLELIDEIVGKKEPITLYTAGGTGDEKNNKTAGKGAGAVTGVAGEHTFTDLCRGGHVENPSGEIKPDSFKLDRVAGAYWRGDEKNKMLTRIYGLAFESKKELDAYLQMREEAEKRDHKKIGKEMGLFVFSPLVGPGLPLWTPKGTIIRELLDDYVWQLRKAKGYSRVTIPHITKKDLYETSGHWKKFADELFKIETREGKVYALKPVNCPHHTQIFASEPRSYRDMPQRYAETTMVYRDEQSGELSGLSRVLSITQDDAHVFCRKNQIEAEVFAIWDIIDTFYKTFGFTNLKIRLSRHDPEHFEKYIGTPNDWQEAEKQLKSLIAKRGINDYIDGAGEAALYGPKVDFMATDSLGRTLQVATIQLDFNMPKNFGLVCTNEKGEKEDVVMIHCAIMGSIERFVATLLEHTAGIFPLWLSPVQVVVIPVRENHVEYARKVADKLRTEGFRVEFADSDENLGKKVRAAKVAKIPYWLAIGDKEITANAVTLESRDRGALGAKSPDEVVEIFRKEVKGKK